MAGIYENRKWNHGDGHPCPGLKDMPPPRTTEEACGMKGDYTVGRNPRPINYTSEEILIRITIRQRLVLYSMNRKRR